VNAKIGVNEAAFPVLNYQPKVSNANQVLVAPPYQKISALYNAYGLLVENSNCLAYNKDLNVVAWTNRHTPYWNASSTPAPAVTLNSGSITTKWSNNNGGSWDSLCSWQAATAAAGNNGRYPSSVIWNPTGNTNGANARIVVTGPTTGGAGWTGNLFGSNAMVSTGGAVSTTNDQQWLSSTAAGAGLQAEFSRYSGAIGGGKVWFGANKYAGGAAGAYGVALMKGTYNAGTDKFDWEQDSSLVNLWTVSGGEGDLGTPQIAFGPDGQTGYVVVNGSDASSTCATCKHYQPNVWKTTDGGATWNRVNQNYDWVTNHAAIWNNLNPTVDGAQVVPAFFDTYGGEIAVDANGVLHYATAVSAGYSIHPDSLGYSYLYQFGFTNQGCDKPWIFDFQTSGNGTWNPVFVDSLNTNKLGGTATDTTSNANPWVDAPKLAYNHRLQVSRSADGTKIFYMWMDGDPSSYAFIDYPGIRYKGLDVTTGNMTATKDNPNTNTNAGFYFMFVSDFAMEPGPGQWIIPATYADSEDQSYSALSPIGIYYVDDNTITAADFTAPSNLPSCAVGVKENSVGNINAVSQNFPNPFSTVSTIKVNLNTAQDVTVSVYNTVGQLVMNKSFKGIAGENKVNIDAASLTSGLYFYSVKAGEEVITKKMTYYF